MATLDNINLFANGGPTENNIEDDYQRLVAVIDSPGIMGTPPTFEEFVAMRQKSQAADVARETMLSQLGEGNVKQAYEEGFTQLPLMEQLGAYVFPPTGVPIESYETGYFTDQAGYGMKSPQEFALDVLNPNKNIFQKFPVKAEDPMSAVLAPLSALGAIGGAFELANIPKAGLMALRRYQQKTMDGGGGGIGGLINPKQEPTLDLAGYKSNTLEEAKSVSAEMSPKALLQYIKSNKRTNPSSNKTGTALKQTEIDEIDFQAFEAQYPNNNYTNEDILQYIDDNRVQLYRVSRSEDNPTYTTKDTEEAIVFDRDEPMTSEIRAEDIDTRRFEFIRHLDDQKAFMQTHFPDGVITKDNYKAFIERQKQFIQRHDINTSGQAPSQLTDAYLANIDGDENPFLELMLPQYDVYKADGTPVAIETIDDPAYNYDIFQSTLDEGYVLKPKILDELFDSEDIADKAATRKVDSMYEDGYGQEALSFDSGEDLFELIGNENDGYMIRLNGSFDNNRISAEPMALDEARLKINQYIRENGEIDLGKFDDEYADDALKDILPEDVITGNSTIPTKYGEQYETFRLPMGGATDYQEHTLHLNNPKTPTRYSGYLGTKHFGGGDELLHYRTTIRTDENGKQVLFVEEVQSDLHSTARSTRSSENYELSNEKRQKIEKQLEEFGVRSNSRNGNRGFGNFFYRGEPGTGGEKMIDMGALPSIARDIKNGRTSQFGSKNADDFVEKFGMEKTQEIGNLVEKLQEGSLPDFPYKKDWVDAAVKDAIKLGAELDVDRVSFTNAAEQVKRNAKKLNYETSLSVKKIPTIEEIKASPEYKQKVAEKRQRLMLDTGDYKAADMAKVNNTNLSPDEILAIINKDLYNDDRFMRLAEESVLDRFKLKYASPSQFDKYQGVGYTAELKGYPLQYEDALSSPQQLADRLHPESLSHNLDSEVFQGADHLMYEIARENTGNIQKSLLKNKEKLTDLLNQNTPTKEVNIQLNKLEGSGKKFVEIYKNEIPRSINKILKDLKVKDVKPSISNVLYSEYDFDPNTIVNTFKKQQKIRADELKGDFIGFQDVEVETHPSIGIDITPEMRNKILEEGLPSMYMGGKVTKSNTMDRPIVGNRREM